MLNRKSNATTPKAASREISSWRRAISKNKKFFNKDNKNDLKFSRKKTENEKWNKKKL